MIVDPMCAPITKRDVKILIVLIIFAIFGIWYLASCSIEADKKKAQEQPVMPKLLYMETAPDGCDYIYQLRGGVCHSAACKNPIHKQNNEKN